MPLLTGALANGVAVIDVLVGVGSARAALLRKHGFRVPEPTRVRALLDTGSHFTGFASSVFRALELDPIWKMDVLTPSTPHDTPHTADLYRVTVSFFVNESPYVMGDCNVIAAESFRADEDVQGLIGLDLLTACQFTLVGPLKAFTLAF